MSKALVTFGTGYAADFLDVSLPLMARYAARHEYDLFVPAPWMIEMFRGGRHPSWAKLEACRFLLSSGCETVLWLDADVVVVRGDEDIADHAPLDRPMSMVVQRTPDGAVPSCGVVVFRNCETTLPLLYAADAAAAPDGSGLVRSGCWWEQAAVIKALGGDPDPTPIVTPPPAFCSSTTRTEILRSIS